MTEETRRLEDDERAGPPPASATPERVGNYRIVGEIGAGGMGVVFKALQEHPVRRTVALKLVKSGLAGTSVIARFESERQTLALMNHPSIAQVFDAGTTNDGRPYFIMEYVDGLWITNYCNQHRLGIRDRLELFLQVCQGVEHAHQKGIIHRDIKPSNVLVTELNDEPVPKIIDFGVAKITGPDLTDATLVETLSGAVGTPAYMSPEQAGGQEDVDTRADVYSLGVLLYELVSGVLPFDFGSMRGFLAVRQAILEQDPPRPSERLGASPAKLETLADNRKMEPAALIRRVRGDLDWIALKALDKDRTRRYASATELAADLTRHLTNDPVVARPPSRAYRTRKLVRKHRIPVVGVAAVIVTFLAMGSVAFWQGRIAERRATQIQEQARQVQANSILASAAAVRDPVAKALLIRELAHLPEPTGRLRVARDVLNLEIPVTVHRGHRGGVSHVAFSPDGARVATSGDDDDAVRVWRSDGTGQPVVLLGHGDRIRSAVFSADGTRVLTASEDATARIWPAGGGEPVVLRGHGDNVWTAAFSPDGSRVVTASSDGSVRIWDVATGAELRALPHGQSVTAAAFSPDGVRVATGSRDGAVRIWSVEDARELRYLRGHEDNVRAASFSPDGTLVLTASWDGTARLWPVDGDEPPIVLQHDAPLTAASFSPDGTRILTASRDGTGRVWSVDDPADAIVLTGHEAAIASAEFSPDGARLLTGSWDGTARLWSADGAGHPLVLRGDEGQVLRARFSPNGQLVVTGHADGTARVWRVAEGGEPRVVHGHGDDILGAAFSPDGAYIVTASRDGTARVQRADGTGEPFFLRGHDDYVSSAVFGPRGERVLTGSGDGTARIWRWQADTDPIVLRLGQPVTAAAFSSNGSRVVTACWDGTARVWSADGVGDPLVLRGHERPVRSAAFSPDDARVVTASWDGTARVWRSDEEGDPVVLAGHDFVWSAAFSPDGEHVVVASGDGDVRIWRADGTGDPVLLEGHPDGVMSAGFSPDGDRVVTACEDGTARVWSVRDRAEMLVLRGHQSRVWSAAFSPDGARVITASEDHTARVWRVTWPGMLDYLRENVRACLTPEQRTRFLAEPPARAAAACAECEARFGRGNGGSS